MVALLAPYCMSAMLPAYLSTVFRRCTRVLTAGRWLVAQAGVLFAPGVLLDGAPFTFGRLCERALCRALICRTHTAHDRK